MPLSSEKDKNDTQWEWRDHKALWKVQLQVLQLGKQCVEKVPWRNTLGWMGATLGISAKLSYNTLKLCNSFWDASWRLIWRHWIPWSLRLWARCPPDPSEWRIEILHWWKSAKCHITVINSVIVVNQWFGLLKNSKKMFFLAMENVSNQQSYWHWHSITKIMVVWNSSFMVLINICGLAFLRRS